MGVFIVLTGRDRRRLRTIASDHNWTFLDKQPARQGALVERQIRSGIRGQGWVYALCAATLSDSIKHGDVAALMYGPHTVNTIWSSAHGGTRQPVLCIPLTDGCDPLDKGDTQHDIRARLIADVLIGSSPARGYELTCFKDAELEGYTLYSIDADTAHTVCDRAAEPLKQFISETAQPWKYRPVLLLHEDGVVVAFKEPVTAPDEVKHVIALGMRVADLA